MRSFFRYLPYFGSHGIIACRVRIQEHFFRLAEVFLKVFFDLHHRAEQPAVIALGTFDGVHVGHATVISAAVSFAQRLKVESAVFTFDILPKNAFLPKPIPAICDNEERAALISKLGVDNMYLMPFAELRSTSADEFINRILIDELCAAHIVCGYDHRFGRKGLGNADLLRSVCRERGVGLTTLPAVMLHGERISSTRVRNAVTEGDMRLVSELLGRNHSVGFCVNDVTDEGIDLVPLRKDAPMPPLGEYAVKLENITAKVTTKVATKVAATLRIRNDKGMPLYTLGLESNLGVNINYGNIDVEFLPQIR